MIYLNLLSNFQLIELISNYVNVVKYGCMRILIAWFGVTHILNIVLIILSPIHVSFVKGNMNYM